MEILPVRGRTLGLLATPKRTTPGCVGRGGQMGEPGGQTNRPGSKEIQLLVVTARALQLAPLVTVKEPSPPLSPNDNPVGLKVSAHPTGCPICSWPICAGGDDIE